MRRDKLGKVMLSADAVALWERKKVRGERLTGDEETLLRKNKEFLRAQADQTAEYCAMMRAAIDPDVLT